MGLVRHALISVQNFEGESHARTQNDPRNHTKWHEHLSCLFVDRSC